MSVLVEAVCVIVRRAGVQRSYPGGWDRFLEIAKAGRPFCSDGVIAAIGFPPPADTGSVAVFIGELEDAGLLFVVDGQCRDIVVVDQRSGPTAKCAWVEFCPSFPLAEVGSVAVCRTPGSNTPFRAPAGWRFKDSLSDAFRVRRERPRARRSLAGRSRRPLSDDGLSGRDQHRNLGRARPAKCGSRRVPLNRSASTSSRPEPFWWAALDGLPNVDAVRDRLSLLAATELLRLSDRPLRRDGVYSPAAARSASAAASLLAERERHRNGLAGLSLLALRAVAESDPVICRRAAAVDLFAERWWPDLAHVPADVLGSFSDLGEGPLARFGAEARAELDRRRRDLVNSQTESVRRMSADGLCLVLEASPGDWTPEAVAEAHRLREGFERLLAFPAGMLSAYLNCGGFGGLPRHLIVEALEKTAPEIAARERFTLVGGTGPLEIQDDAARPPWT